jgi:hypothetical protein
METLGGRSLQPFQNIIKTWNITLSLPWKISFDLLSSQITQKQLNFETRGLACIVRTVLSEVFRVFKVKKWLEIKYKWSTLELSSQHALWTTIKRHPSCRTTLSAHHSPSKGIPVPRKCLQ